jgi:hypothetical protein
VHSLLTLQITDAGKFAGVASQFQQDKNHSVQYPVNMVDEASF